MQQSCLHARWELGVSGEGQQGREPGGLAGRTTATAQTAQLDHRAPQRPADSHSALQALTLEEYEEQVAQRKAAATGHKAP